MVYKAHQECKRGLACTMSYSTGAIKEANKHIEALSRRCLEMEERVKELSEILRQQNESHAEQLQVLPLRMNNTMKQKDEEIQELKKKLDSSQDLIEKLVREVSERDSLVLHLRNKCRVLDEMAKHRGALEQILSCLEIIEEPEYDSDSGKHLLTNNNIFCSETTKETYLVDNQSDGETARDGNVQEQESWNRISPSINRFDSGVGESISQSSSNVESPAGSEFGLSNKRNMSLPEDVFPPPAPVDV